MHEFPVVPSNYTTLQDFVKNSRVVATSIKINQHYFTRVGEIAAYKKSWPREPFNFGQEKYVNLEGLESRLTQIVQGYKAVSSKPVVMVAYDMGLDVEAMRQDFTNLASHFSHVVDFRTVLRSALDSVESKIPGLSKSLALLGYSGHGSLAPGSGKKAQLYHNAGNDAVKALVLLNGLMDSEGLQTIKASTSIDLARTRIIRANQQPPQQNAHTVIIETFIRNAKQPAYLASPLELAAFISPYHCPIKVGIYRGDAKYKGKNLRRVVRGWAVFSDQNAVQSFVTATNGKVINGTCLRTADCVQYFDEDKEWRTKKNARRRNRKAEATRAASAVKSHPTGSKDQKSETNIQYGQHSVALSPTDKQFASKKTQASHPGAKKPETKNLNWITPGTKQDMVNIPTTPQPGINQSSATKVSNKDVAPTTDSTAVQYGSQNGLMKLKVEWRSNERGQISLDDGRGNKETMTETGPPKDQGHSAKRPASLLEESKPEEPKHLTMHQIRPPLSLQSREEPEKRQRSGPPGESQQLEKCNEDPPRMEVFQRLEDGFQVAASASLDLAKPLYSCPILVTHIGLRLHIFIPISGLYGVLQRAQVA